MSTELSITAKSVAEALRNNEGFTSGERLAEALELSRTAIWKAIKELRRAGFEIEASTRLGYRLTREKYLDAGLVKRYLSHAFVEPHVYRSIASTNTTAKAMAEEGACEGTLVLADHQTSGRGRVGKSFYSPDGSGLYMSLVLRPRMSAGEALRITACAAVSTAEAIEEVTGIRAGIKWVNDLFVGDKKVCGILTEASFNIENGGLDYAVLGVGINVFEPKEGFGDLADIAGALLPYSEDSCIIRSRLAAAVADRFLDRYESLTDEKLLDDYRKRLFVLNKQVYVIRGDKQIPATVIDIDDRFRLAVKYADGTTELLDSGEISIIPV